MQQMPLTGMGDEAEIAAITATGAYHNIIKPYADNDYIFRRIEHAERWFGLVWM